MLIFAVFCKNLKIGGEAILRKIRSSIYRGISFFPVWGEGVRICGYPKNHNNGGIGRDQVDKPYKLTHDFGEAFL